MSVSNYMQENARSASIEVKAYSAPESLSVKPISANLNRDTPHKLLFEKLSNYNSTSTLKSRDFSIFVFRHEQMLIDECYRSPELTVLLYMAGVKFRKDALNEGQTEKVIQKTEQELYLIHKTLRHRAEAQKTMAAYSVMRKQLDDCHTQLSSPVVSDETIKKVSRFITQHVAWFYLDSVQTSHLTYAESNYLIQTLKSMHTKLLEINETHTIAQVSLATKLAAQITRILPQPRLDISALPISHLDQKITPKPCFTKSADLELHIYKHLPAASTADVQESLRTILSCLPGNHARINTIRLAWINFNHIPPEKLL